MDVQSDLSIGSRTHSVIVAPPSRSSPCLVASTDSIAAAPEPSAVAAVAKPSIFATISNRTFMAPSSAIRFDSHHASRTRALITGSEPSHSTRASGTNAIADSHPHTSSCRVISCHTATNVNTQQTFRNHTSVCHMSLPVPFPDVALRPPATLHVHSQVCPKPLTKYISRQRACMIVVVTAAHRAAHTYSEPTSD